VFHRSIRLCLQGCISLAHTSSSILSSLRHKMWLLGGWLLQFSALRLLVSGYRSLRHFSIKIFLPQIWRCFASGCTAILIFTVAYRYDYIQKSEQRLTAQIDELVSSAPHVERNRPKLRFELDQYARSHSEASLGLIANGGLVPILFKAYLYDESQKNTPCLIGQTEDMLLERCVWQTVDQTGLTESQAVIAMKVAIDAIENGQFKSALASVEPFARDGNPHAQRILAEMYEHGWGVEKNERASNELLRIAADQNEHLAQFELAEKLTHKCREECPNAEEALELYKKAAQGGVEQAKEEIARMYSLGMGIPIDQEIGLEWTIKAAKAGLTESQRVLGQIYFLGAGVDQNYGLAFHYLNQSAQKGDAASMTVLAQLYGEGKGTQKDGVKAAGLLWMAAVKGHGVAQVAIGELMTRPENGSQDTLRGLMWLYLAMEQNADSAQDIFNAAIDGRHLEDMVLVKTLAQACKERGECGNPTWAWEYGYQEASL
jgi:TPR repeat protein